MLNCFSIRLNVCTFVWLIISILCFICMPCYYDITYIDLSSDVICYICNVIYV